MELWYVVKYIETDQNSLGINEITKRKLGKCFGKDTPIRMYDGSVKMVQDIMEGELVCPFSYIQFTIKQYLSTFFKPLHQI